MSEEELRAKLVVAVMGIVREGARGEMIVEELAELDVLLLLHVIGELLAREDAPKEPLPPAPPNRTIW